MITNELEYQAVRRQASELTEWLSRLDRDTDRTNAVTFCNIHSRLASIHREMADFKNPMAKVSATDTPRPTEE
ncbi:MAG: hypothetical protein HZA46_03240 [Planctomycetales bacterium]|nr:hypothetical protein [Planctomycetales bacterium]